MKSDMRTLLCRPGGLKEGSFPLLIQLLTDLRETPQIFAIRPGFTNVLLGSLFLRDSIVSLKTPASGTIFFSLWSGFTVILPGSYARRLPEYGKRGKERQIPCEWRLFRQRLVVVIEVIISFYACLNREIRHLLRYLPHNYCVNSVPYATRLLDVSAPMYGSYR